MLWTMGVGGWVGGLLILHVSLSAARDEKKRHRVEVVTIN